MAPTNPEYVRLSDRMVSGLCVDMESGWSISGFDVQPFPEARDQQRFVKQKLNAGVLERASAAEYEEAHPEDEEDAAEDARAFVEAVRIAASNKQSGRQEHRVRQSHEERQTAVRAARFAARLEEEGIDPEDFDPDAYEYALDKKRRESIMEEQQEEVTDDPEEQKERSATRAPVKSTAKKAASSRRKSAKSKEESDDDDSNGGGDDNGGQGE